MTDLRCLIGFHKWCSQDKKYLTHLPMRFCLRCLKEQVQTDDGWIDKKLLDHYFEILEKTRQSVRTIVRRVLKEEGLI